MATDAARLRAPAQATALAPPHCWRFSPQALIDSPSRADGVTMEEEASLRRGGVAHILEMAARGFQDGKDRAPATAAAVLFNRFFARQSFARFDRWLVATAAFLTSCKVEEGHRKVRDVLAMSLRARYGSGSRRGALPDPAGPDFAALRDRLTDMERQLLHALQFDVSVELPFATVTGTLLRWRDGGSLGRRDEAGAVASQLDRAACGIAQALAVSEAGLLFTGPEIGACALWLAWRHLRAGGGLPAALARQDTEDALFFGSVSGSDDGSGGGGLIRDRRLAAAVLQCYRSMVAQRLEDDEHLRAAAAARLAAAGQRPAPAAASATGSATSGNVTPYSYGGSATPGPVGGAASGGGAGGGGSAGHGSAAFSVGGVAAGVSAEGTTPSGILAAATGVTGGGAGSAPPTGLSGYGSSSAAAVPSPSLIGAPQAAPTAAAAPSASSSTFAAAGGVSLTAVAAPAAAPTAPTPGTSSGGLSALMARMHSMVQQSSAASSSSAVAGGAAEPAAQASAGTSAPSSAGAAPDALGSTSAVAQLQPPAPSLLSPGWPAPPAAGAAASSQQSSSATGGGSVPTGPGFQASSSSAGAVRARSLSSGLPTSTLSSGAAGSAPTSLIAAMTAGAEDVAMVDAATAAPASR